MMATCPPPLQELKTDVRYRSAGSGVRVERGLPGVFAFLSKEVER